MNEKTIFVVPGISKMRVSLSTKQSAYSAKKVQSDNHKEFLDTKEDFEELLTESLKQYVIPKGIFELQKKIPSAIEVTNRVSLTDLFDSIPPSMKLNFTSNHTKKTVVTVDNRIPVELKEPIPIPTNPTPIRSCSELIKLFKTKVPKENPEQFAELENLAMKLVSLYCNDVLFMAEHKDRVGTPWFDLYPGCYDLGDLFEKDPEMYVLAVKNMLSTIKASLPALNIERIFLEYDSSDRVWRDIEATLKL